MSERVTEECIEAAQVAWREPRVATRDGSVAFFTRRLPERLSRSRPITPYLVVGPLAAYWLWEGMGDPSPLFIGLSFAAGWLAWTLTEYVMHRFFFHFPARGLAGQVATFMVHGHHHVYPKDPARLVATPVQFGSLLLLAFGVAQAVPSPTLRHAGLAGFAVGYLVYEYVHYLAHHGQPRTPLGKALKRHHLRHHHETPQARWGISSPLWDHVFGSI